MKRFTFPLQRVLEFRRQQEEVEVGLLQAVVEAESLDGEEAAAFQAQETLDTPAIAGAAIEALAAPAEVARERGRTARQGAQTRSEDHE